MENDAWVFETIALFCCNSMPVDRWQCPVSENSRLFESIRDIPLFWIRVEHRVHGSRRYRIPSLPIDIRPWCLSRLVDSNSSFSRNEWRLDGTSQFLSIKERTTSLIERETWITIMNAFRLGQIRNRYLPVSFSFDWKWSEPRPIKRSAIYQPRYDKRDHLSPFIDLKDKAWSISLVAGIKSAFVKEARLYSIRRESWRCLRSVTTFFLLIFFFLFLLLFSSPLFFADSVWTNSRFFRGQLKQNE